MPINVEIKAITNRTAQIRDLLTAHKAEYKGTDQQEDTYFAVPEGRLKLRLGNVEQNLIYYVRPDQAGPKRSDVYLYQPNAAAGESLKTVLTASLGVKKIVRKVREIYYIDNVKFHLDQVDGLGTFVEIEAIDQDGSRGEAELLSQCQHYMALFGIEEKDLLQQSYSDML